MKKLFLFALTLACLATARAAVPVGASGSGVITFTNAPTIADGWATLTNMGGSADIGDTTQLLNAVNTNIASQINMTLPTTGTVNPSISSQTMWRYNTANQNVQSVVTGVGYTTLLATLLNTSGSDQNSLTVTYDLGELHAAGSTVVEELPGVHVYFSLTGAAGSWTEATALSRETPGTTTATINLGGTWANNTEMYIIWADDNANANRNDGGTEEGGYTLDNVSFNPGAVVVPLTVTLTTPTNGAVFVAPATVAVSANAGGTTPADSVTFFTNGVAYATVATAPYEAPLSELPEGTYAIHARATNANEVALSATNTVTVRPAAVSYTGGTVAENFDSMGPAGSVTPIGWYVGAALPANSIFVTPGDGSAGASGAVLGWNYGLTDSGDRALGTAPTGNDRNIVLRIQNNTSSNIVAFQLLYDGEVWRNYTNEVDGWLTNYVSTDGGANWTATGFNFEQPASLRVEPQGSVNGNDAGNRTADIGGTFALLSPITPGSALYLRWHDFNGGGVTDGGLAVDNVRFTATFDIFQNFVSITSPTNGQTFAEGAPITINAIAAMSNPVTNVSFFRDGGVLIGSDITAPYSAVYSNAMPGAHTLTATAQDTLGNSISTTNVVTITVNPNVPPSITLTNPSDTSFLVGANITNFVSATDSDGTIARVDYYVDGVLVYADATPAKFEYADALAGTHIISAIAVDNLGATGSNGVTLTITNPPGVTLLVTNGATWRYLDDTTDPGPTWRQLLFNDSGWSNGVAELGFGDNAQDRPERTVVRRNVGTTTNITFYFRLPFVVSNLASFSSVQLELMADDGAVVYINETEVYRTTNMAVNPVTHTTLADDTAPDDGAGYFWRTNLDSSVLIDGINIVAVEVHQESVGSSDVSFDLMLWGESAGGPRMIVTRTSATQAEIAWPDSFTGYVLEFKTDLNQPTWAPETAPITQSGGYFRATVDTSSGNKFWRLRRIL